MLLAPDTVQSLTVRNRRVFVRVDFNVPLADGGEGSLVVTDVGRIEGALPTIRYLMDSGAKVILGSHLGRPNGRPEKKYSLEPAGRKLSELLGKEVILPEQCVGDGPKALSMQLCSETVMLLENLRFHPGEELNSQDFAQELAQLCDVYVSDAFGSLHRAHASTYLLPKLISTKGIGFLIQKELKFLEPLRSGPKRPLVLVMGGAKISDKIGILEHFLLKADRFVIGGAMAYPFLKSQGKCIGTSLCPEDQIPLAAKILKSAVARNIKVELPIDHVVVKFGERELPSITQDATIAPDETAVDIGPKTLDYFKASLEGAQTIFWNGPMGLFEKEQFAQGTYGLARMIASLKGLKLAGGGDSAAAIAQAGVSDKFDFISTGGGATLEYLEGKYLPGLEALMKGRN